MWPQITYIVLAAVSVGLHLAKDGEPRPPYSFWTKLFVAACVTALLYAGGFFDPLLAGASS